MLLAAPPRTLRRSGFPIGSLLGVALGGLLVFGAAAVGMVPVLGTVALLVAGSVLIWKWPQWAAICLAALVPVNRFLILVGYHYSGSDLLTRATQVWKDGLVAILFARVCLDVLFAKARPRLRYLDLLVAAFVGLSVIYLFYSGPLDTDLTTRIAGFRSNTYFMLAYFVGRWLHLHTRDVRWLVLGLIPGSIAVAGFAFWEVLAPSQADRLFNFLGFEEFIKSQGGLFEANIRERVIDGVHVTRAGSLLLGDLALAFYQVLLVPVAAALFFLARSRGRQIAAAAFLLLMVATMLTTVNRSAVLAVAAALGLTAIIGRSLRKLALTTGVCLVMAVGAMVTTGVDLDTLNHFISTDESSAQAHINAFWQSLQVIQDDPLGRGIGTAGDIAQRSGGSALVTENWFLQLASEMGVLSGALYFLALASLVVICSINHQRGHDPWLRTLTLAMAGASVGFLVIGNFLHAFEVPVISILFWLMAGIAVTAPELEGRSPAAVTA